MSKFVKARHRKPAEKPEPQRREQDRDDNRNPAPAGRD